MITLKQKFFDTIVTLHYSKKTFKSYWVWVNKFLRYHNCQHALSLDSSHVEDFLTSLAIKHKVSASTQNLALNAIVFLYKKVYKQPLEGGINAIRAKKRLRKPLVLSEHEIQGILNKLTGTNKLIVQLLYGSGLRINECLNLRIQNIDFENHRIRIVDSKSYKDRITVMAKSMEMCLKSHIEKVKSIHNSDLKSGKGYVQLPFAFHNKNKNAAKQFLWQFLFPSCKYSPCLNDFIGRWHKHANTVQNEIRRVVDSCGIHKRVTCHTFRHSFATHLLQRGHSIKIVQEALGHSQIETTMTYLHALDIDIKKTISPLDTLCHSHPSPLLSE
jgi:integron integrase